MLKYYNLLKPIKELTDNIPSWAYYPQLEMSNPQLEIYNWGLGIYESGNEDSENKSPIPNWLKYHQLGICNIHLRILYLIGYFLLLVLYQVLIFLKKIKKLKQASENGKLWDMMTNSGSYYFGIISSFDKKKLRKRKK